MKVLKNTLALTLACGVALAFADRADAARRVTGFESSDPAIANKAGDAGVVGSFLGVAPVEGSNQFLITTLSSTDDDGLSPNSGTNSVINMSLQNFFNTTLVGTEGSGLIIPFTVNAGETALTFNYDFLTDESPTPFHNDFAFYTLFDATGAHNIITAMTAQSGLSLLSDQSGAFQFHSGYQSFSISLTGLTPGSYSLGIGVEDRTTNDIASGLLIDNVQVVPETSTVLLFVVGTGLLLMLRKRIVSA